MVEAAKGSCGLTLSFPEEETGSVRLYMQLRDIQDWGQHIHSTSPHKEHPPPLIAMVKPFFTPQWLCHNICKAWLQSPALQTKQGV